MSKLTLRTVDGFEAVANIAYRLSDLLLTTDPSHPMALRCAAWARSGRTNAKKELPRIHPLGDDWPEGSTLLSTAQDIAGLIPRLRKLNGRAPLVVHLSYEGLDELPPLGSSGLALFVSGSPSEALETARKVHALALQSRSPVLHAFHSTWTGTAFGVLKNDDAASPLPAYEYLGHPEADCVFVAMGSEAETLRAWMGSSDTLRRPVGLVRVRQWRPFLGREFLSTFPATTRTVTVLDTLYQDVLSSFHEGMTGGWSWFTSFPKMISVATMDAGKDLDRRKPYEVVLTGLPLEAAHAVRHLLSLLSEKTDHALQAHAIRQDGVKPLWTIPIRMGAPGQALPLAPVTQPDLTFSLCDEGTAVVRCAPETNERTIDILGAARRAGLEPSVGPAIEAFLVSLLDIEGRLGLKREPIWEALQDSFKARWEGLSLEISAAHARILEIVRNGGFEVPSSQPKLGQPKSKDTECSPKSQRTDTNRAVEGRCHYLEYDLPSPVVVTVAPGATDDMTDRALSEIRSSSAGAVFYGPLFEEDLSREAWKIFHDLSQAVIPPLGRPETPLGRHIAEIRRIKERSDRKLFAGVVVSTRGDCLSLAFALEQAGADALEIAFETPDSTDALLKTVSLVASALKIPVVVRLGIDQISWQMSWIHSLETLRESGARAVTLFHQPRALNPEGTAGLSSSEVFRLALPWVSRLANRVPLDLSIAGEAASQEEIRQALQAGSKIVFVPSNRIRSGFSRPASP